MKFTLLLVLPFAAEFALARPAPDDAGDLFSLDEGVPIAATGSCIASEPVGNVLSGICSNEAQANRVLYKSTCPIGKCSVPSPRCDTGAGIGMGYCMNSGSKCSPKDGRDGRAGRPGKIVQSWCYEEGILCCDGEVTNVVSFDLPSQFIDAILPSYDQFSNTGNLDLFSSDIPLDDGSVQYSLLGGGTSDNLFASNEFTPSGDVVYQDQNDLVAVGANGGDVSWFQS